MESFPHRYQGPDDRVLVIETPQWIDHSVADQLRAEAIRLMPSRDDAGLVLDFSRTRMLTSIGIASLLQVAEFCQDQDSLMCLARVDSRITDLLRMLNLLNKFTIFDEIDDAITWAAGSANA